MKTLRRHWQTVVAVFVVLLLGGTLLWRSTAGHTALAQGPPSYEPLSELDRDAILTLLEDTQLDRDALIALNPAANQAETVLSEVRTWREDNVARLASAKQTIDRKVVAVRQVQKAIRMGPYDASHSSQLSVARQDLTDARETYDTLLASLKTAVRAELSESQRATWSAIQSGHGQKMPIRMLNLSDQQRLALGKAQLRYRRQNAAASTSQLRDSARNTWHNELGQILTQDQQNVIDAYHGYYVMASEAVAGAFETVLALADQG